MKASLRAAASQWFQEAIGMRISYTENTDSSLFDLCEDRRSLHEAESSATRSRQTGLKDHIDSQVLVSLTVLEPAIRPRFR